MNFGLKWGEKNPHHKLNYTILECYEVSDTV